MEMNRAAPLALTSVSGLAPQISGITVLVLLTFLSWPANADTQKWHWGPTDKTPVDLLSDNFDLVSANGSVSDIPAGGFIERTYMWFKKGNLIIRCIEHSIVGNLFQSCEELQR